METPDMFGPRATALPADLQGLSRLRDLYGLDRWWRNVLGRHLPHDCALVGEASLAADRFQVVSILLQHGPLHEDDRWLLARCSALLGAWNVMKRAAVIDLGPCRCVGARDPAAGPDDPRRFLAHACPGGGGSFLFLIISAPGWPDEAARRGLVERLVPHLAQAAQRIAARRLVLRPAPDRPAPPALTPREREIVGALCEGLTNKEIGRLLGTSPNTVRNQIARLCRRTGARGRAQLALLVERC